MTALLLSAVAVMPVFGQTAGTVEFDRSHIAPIDGTNVPFATITVDDEDLNVVATRTEDVNGTWGSIGTTVFFYIPDSAGATGTDPNTGFGNGTAAGDELIPGEIEIVDTTGSEDIGDYVINVVQPSTGRISIQYVGGAPAPGAVTLAIEYDIATVNETTVLVSSPAVPNGFNMTLTETDADSGIFTGWLAISTTTTDENNVVDSVEEPSLDDPAFPGTGAALPIIQAFAGSNVTVRYEDDDPDVTRTDTIRVEDTGPRGVLVSPADDSFTTNTEISLVVDFTDLDSGIDPDTLNIVITGGGAVIADLETTAITGGYRVTAELDGNVGTNDTIPVTWYAEARDNGGNYGRTDADASTAGDQDFTVIIDNRGPNFAGASAFAGRWFDTADNEVVDDPADSMNTVIAILLPDINGVEEELDPDSVSPSDFEIDNLVLENGTEVDDVTPQAANVYPDAPNYIFLTVQAMAPSATPVVTLLDTGSIEDAQGNETEGETVLPAATDAQAPDSTASWKEIEDSDTIVTRDGMSALDQQQATLVITTNEPANITVFLWGEGSSTNGIFNNPQNLGAPSLVGVDDAIRTYEINVDPSGTGLFSVTVEVDDAVGNQVDLGVATVTDDFPTSNQIALYIDNAIPEPDVDFNIVDAEEGGSVEVEIANPFFITVNFDAEGDEYGLNQDGDILLTANEVPGVSTVTDDLDVNNTVTIATATLDGVDITDMIDTQDNRTFNWTILVCEDSENDPDVCMTTGEHTLVLVGMDEAGNETDELEYEFTVIARQPYEVAMRAGWNLISLPGDPQDPDINSVLPPEHPATTVYQFENGVWRFAERVAGGTWDGTLETINANSGYWVYTTASDPVSVLLELPAVGATQTPPTITLRKGWNLISKIDVAQTAQNTPDGSDGDTLNDDCLSADAYFSGISWSVAYTFNAQTRTWERKTETPQVGNVCNGQGIWVWATSAGTLIP